MAMITRESQIDRMLLAHLQWFSNERMTGSCDVTNAFSLIATITSCGNIDKNRLNFDRQLMRKVYHKNHKFNDLGSGCEATKI